MALPTVKSAKEKNYLKKIYLIYGPPKAGKTTIVSKFGGAEGDVLFFASEPGHKFQEIYKWKNEKSEEPTSWLHFKTCAKELIQQKDKHNFKCLAIDTVDNLYKWCTQYVCKKHGIEHESDLGFGKGYALVKEEFMGPILALGQHGFGIIFVSHAKDRDKELGNTKLTYTDTTLAGSASTLICGLCDYILYFNLDYEGNRFIRTKGTKTVNAGDRSGKMPETLPMNADELINALKGGEE